MKYSAVIPLFQMRLVSLMNVIYKDLRYSTIQPAWQPSCQLFSKKRSEENLWNYFFHADCFTCLWRINVFYFFPDRRLQRKFSHFLRTNSTNY